MTPQVAQIERDGLILMAALIAFICVLLILYFR